MSFYSKSMFDVMIERQQILQIKTQLRSHNLVSVSLSEPKYLYLSLGTRLSSGNNRTYHYDVQLLEYKEHFGIQTLFSGHILFDDLVELIEETLKEYSKTKLCEEDEMMATNKCFRVVNLLDIQKM